MRRSNIASLPPGFVTFRFPQGSIGGVGAPKSVNNVEEFGRIVRDSREAKGLSLEWLAQAALGNAARKGYVSEIETGKRTNIKADTIRKIAGALEIVLDETSEVLRVVDPRPGAAPTPLEIKLADLDGTVTETHQIVTDIKATMDAFLAGKNIVPLEALQDLAEQFGGAEDASRDALIAFLTDKAGEYRAFQEQIEAIDERTTGLGNLKSAARDAADRLDLAEVEDLLARVDQVETEIAAETKELRADNALLRGRLGEAFRHLSAAADSFAGLDPLEPGRRRSSYEDRFYKYGLRYGGDGLALSIQMSRAALWVLTEVENPVDWARVQRNLALALQVLGSRVGGESGRTLLAEAAKASCSALRVFTEEAYPVDWAKTQQNLAITLEVQGSRVVGNNGLALLAEAVAAFRAALRVRTEAEHPADWAMTQQNLAVTLTAQGGRVGGDVGEVLLAQAVDACRAALRVRTKELNPVQWAMTQQNLANSLTAQAGRLGAERGQTLLAEAVVAYREALQVFTEAVHPVDWAFIQQNLAVVLVAQGDRVGGVTGHALLEQAVEAYRAILRIFTETAHPADWAMTQQNLAIALRNLGSQVGGEDGQILLDEAVEAYRAALRVFTQAAHPEEWAAVRRNLGIALDAKEQATCGTP